MKRRFLAGSVLLGLVMGGLSGGAFAQSFPSQPVTIIVPFAPGGGVDVLMRAMANELSARWRQTVIVDNRAGAGTVIGTGAASRATPDGYTLLATTSQTFTANRFLYKSLPYSPDSSFVPISMLVKADQFLVANATVPLDNLSQLVALARERKGAMTYGSWGVGSEPQITFEQLKNRERFDITHVPYKGVAPLLQALVAGEVNVSVASAATAGTLFKAGKVKPLAVAASSRSSRFPSVPTAAEAGYPYLRTAILIGLFAPAGTPAPVVDRIGRDVRELLQTPAFADKQVIERGFDVVASGADDALKLLHEETARLKEVVEAVGIKPE